MNLANVFTPVSNAFNKIYNKVIFVTLGTCAYLAMMCYDIYAAMHSTENGMGYMAIFLTLVNGTILAGCLASILTDRLCHKTMEMFTFMACGVAAGLIMGIKSHADGKLLDVVNPTVCWIGLAGIALLIITIRKEN